MQHLQNNFSKYLVLNTLAVLGAFLTSCSDSTHTNSDDISTPKQPVYSYALLGPLSDADVEINRVSDTKLAYKTKTKIYDDEIEVVWPENTIGSFVVDINNSFEDDDLMLVHVTSGIDVDPDDNGKIIASELRSLNGHIYTYATVADLKAKGVKVNALTTLAALKITNEKSSEEIISKLTAYAKDILRLSINDDEAIDYKDLASYIPNVTEDKHFLNPNFYRQLHTSGLITAIHDDSNLTAYMASDTDSDGLSLEEEILAGSSPFLSDSDGDGLNDALEIELGYNPSSIDSDFDDINDFDEIELGTDPLNPDTDNDFIPDGVELQRLSNPLDGDENSDSSLDGLDGDPFFKYQWHLKSSNKVVNNTNNIKTIAGNDLDIMDVYHYQIGNENSTIVQVVDTGVELIHEDLVIDLTRSINAINGTNDPTATFKIDSRDSYSPYLIGHGTAVAGIIAARANNAKGLRGVVPYAKIAGSNWLEEQSLHELERVWYSGTSPNEILVSNNSWGSYYLKDKSFEDIMKLSTEQLRSGKGRIFTVAAGNDRKEYGNSNLSYLANNRYAIAVASLNHENTFSFYSNPGSNILVSAYGGERYYEAPTIATTLLTSESYYESELGLGKGAITFDDDTAKSYTYAMNGTSSATPMVSGAIALTLESCPDLSWRDVRWLLSYTSKKIDGENDKWIMNSAGREHNINYGYGLVDANAMIQECRSKYYTNLSNEKVSTVSSGILNLEIPDNETPVRTSIEFSDSYVVEWVELVFDSNHPYAGDLEIVLISASGTKTQIITPNEMRTSAYKDGFRFSSAAFIGENSKGEWKVEVTDQLENDTGAIVDLELTVYGH